MRTLVHLSDLHFGRVEDSMLSPLIEKVGQARPNLVVVSGDLTQRARSWQFKEARLFLDKLPTPQIVVPGNHDVPLHNVFSRFLRPLGKYRRYITNDLQPVYQDDEMIVLGLNTARSLTVKGGRINKVQVAWAREKLCSRGDGGFKVIVTHHPFDLPEGHDERKLLGRARMAMETLAACGADLFLAGHLHVSYTGQTAARYRMSGHSPLVVQAGTAASTRGRGEANSFNIIRLDHSYVTVERFIWEPRRLIFVASVTQQFGRAPGGWTRISGETSSGLNISGG